MKIIERLRDLVADWGPAGHPEIDASPEVEREEGRFRTPGRYVHPDHHEGALTCPECGASLHYDKQHPYCLLHGEYEVREGAE